MLFIVIASTLLQFAAGYLALRLIAESGKSWAWKLLSAGIFIMAFRRMYTLYQLHHAVTVPTLSYELLGLAISILVFSGIYLIAPLLRDMRNANQELAESEARYRTVAEFTHDWEYWLGPDGNFLYVSPACERITGHTPQAFRDDPSLFQRIIHPQDSEHILKQTAIMEEMHKPQRFDYRIVDDKGDTHWVALVRVPVYSEDGLFLGVRGSIRDIDHRKALEQELRDNQTLYKGLVEDSRSMVLRLDGTGEVTFANGYALTHLDMAGSPLVGTNIRDILAGEANPEPAETGSALEGLLRGGERTELEAELRRQDGPPVWSEWVGTAIRDDRGGIAEFIFVGIDVTRRKALDKLKEDVTRIIRHDLKSPLSGIIGIPRVLRRDDNLTERQKELLQTVEDAGTVMLDLINQSLDLYKLETGTYEFQPEEFDLLALLEEIAQHVRIGKNNPVPIRINLDGRPAVAENVLPVNAERSLIFTVLGNLLRNGLEASEGKPVTVDVARNGEYRIAIHNSGVVPESIRDTFFEKYVTKDKAGGTGLGTYSARLIARRHGGDVTMRTSQGDGTTITVTLPRPPRGD